MNVFRKIEFLLTPSERHSAILLMGLMVIGMVLETLSVGLVVPAIMTLLQNNFQVNFPAIKYVFTLFVNISSHSMIVGGIIVLVCAYLIKSLFLAFLVWRQMKFAFDIQTRLSLLLFQTYLRQPYTFHLQRNSAFLIRNAITEVGAFSAVLVQAILFITECLVIIGIGSLLLAVEPLGTMIVVLTLSGISWAYHRSTMYSTTKWGESRQYHEGKRMQHLQQGLGGVKDVKLLGREDDFLAQYSVHNVQSAKVSQLQSVMLHIPRLWLELLAVVGMALLVLCMFAQERTMTSIVSLLALFSVAAFRLIPSVNRILSAMSLLRFSLPIVNTLYEELKDIITGPVAKNAKDFLIFQKEIYLNGVSYTYPDASMPALKNLSIIIRKGELVGFIGPSGSGKSTLVDIILGLLAPQEGQVMLDGQDIQQSLRAWQNQIGYVPQSIYLTDDTIRRNIAFGLANTQIDDTAVFNAVKAAQLEDFVSGLPEGLETIVGERGIKLSGGERQRIGIARALYHDPAVLVLDEATSALDIGTENGVMKSVTALKGIKTILIVAHRLSTVEHCSRLYRLKKGRVVAEGLTAEMLNTMKIASRV
jgi:ABC-type multidrug transport system fused ATPase/permease subunit